MRVVRVIGVDCAVDPRNVGLALADWSQGSALLTDVCTCRSRETPAKVIAHWVSGSECALLAMDAPLGWPAALGDQLSGHEAGGPIAVSPDSLFRRHTDRFIQRTLRKTPLDVGADRIARTAWSALKLLQDLRELTHSPIRTAWSPQLSAGIWAIEVYPAGTLKAHGLPNTGYKKPTQEHVRVKILEGLSSRMTVQSDESLLLEDADCLDSAVCVLAAQDFLNGDCYFPAQEGAVQREGWIWVSRPKLI